MTSITDELLGGAEIAVPKAPSAPGGSITDELLTGRSSGHSMSSSPDTPITRLMQKGRVAPKDDPSLSAGMGTQALASMPSDIGDRIKYFAAKRFPGLSPKEAMSRYSVTDGRIYYVDDEGQAVFEEPKADLSMKGMGKFVASGAGPALPMIGGTLGAMIPAGGGFPGAMGGAAIGDQLRQSIAKDITQADNPGGLMQTGKEMALAGGGQALGKVAVAMGNRLAARDLGRLDNPAARSQMQNLQNDASRWGVDLTPAETTNLKSLKGQQRVLQDMPRSADTMGDFYNRRNTEQVPRAVTRAFEMFSPEASAEVGARRLQTGAQRAIDKAKDVRKTAAKPIYDEVMTPDNRLTPSDFNELMANQPVVADALKSIRSDTVLASSVKNLDDSSLPVLDLAKRHLDDLHAAAQQSGQNNRARIIAEAREKLIASLDEKFPRYKEARDAFAGNSPDVTALTEGAVGVASEAGETAVNRVPRIIFESGPNTIRQNRAAYEKAGALQDWNDGLRAYLQDAFGKASKETATGAVPSGTKFRTAIFGTPQQKESLKAAMTNDQWLGFNSLMNVLEATGRVPTSGSMTTFNQLAVDEMRSQAGGVGGSALKAAGTAIQPQNWGATLNKWIDEIRLGQHSEKLAEIITQPDAMTKLKALRLMSPRAEKSRYAVYQVLTQAGFEGVDSELNQEPDNQTYQPDETKFRSNSAASASR